MAGVRVCLARVGPVAAGTLAPIGRAIETALGCKVEIGRKALDPISSFDSARQQYWSTPLLHHLEVMGLDGADRMLGITQVDLFIPILTYVFGEALLNRPPAIISLYRLSPSFYGLPEDRDLVLERAQKEAVHELGHTFGLIHCPDYACVMHASRVADEIDLKSSSFCAECAAHLSNCDLRPRQYRH